MAGKRGAPKGNKHAVGRANPDRPWSDALRRAIVQRDGVQLRKLADAIVDKALSGDVVALKEIGDRLDGKPHQSVSATVDSSVTVVVNKLAD